MERIEKNIESLFSEIDKSIHFNFIDNAFELSLKALSEIKKLDKESEMYIFSLFKISGFFVDIGHLGRIEKASNIGLTLLEKNGSQFLELFGEYNYFYFLANAKSNFIKVNNPFEHDFDSISDLVEHKGILWKCFKVSKVEQPHALTNLANSLKQQFRLIEAIQYYDEVISKHPETTQAWINRSETLEMLNELSGSFSISMLEVIHKGYVVASESVNIPDEYNSFYTQRARQLRERILSICEEEGIKPSEYDSHETETEYNALSEYRRFCLDNFLSLSDHGIYCKCNGSEIDDLSIPNANGISGDFIEPMEKLLNRIKSEFGFARRLYYEYLSIPEDEQSFFEAGFSELYDSEILGCNIEKLRTSFRLCFSILDKIGIGVCEMFDAYPNNSKEIYFTNMWRLDNDPDRSKFFSKLKNPNLLALYSIASDLNEHKSGEWSFFKEYRNALEHDFAVIYEGSEIPNTSEDFSFKKEIKYIHKNDFESNLLLMLQLTRSAIFSFAYAVRYHSLQNENDSLNIPLIMQKK